MNVLFNRRRFNSKGLVRVVWYVYIIFFPRNYIHSFIQTRSKSKSPYLNQARVSVSFSLVRFFSIKYDDERVIFTGLLQASSGASYKKGKLIPFPRPTQSLVYLEERGKTCTCYCTSIFVLVMHNRKIRNSSVIAPPFFTQLQTNKQKLDKRNTHSSPAGEGETL